MYISEKPFHLTVFDVSVEFAGDVQLMGWLGELWKLLSVSNWTTMRGRKLFIMRMMMQMMNRQES